MRGRRVSEGWQCPEWLLLALSELEQNLSLPPRRRLLHRPLLHSWRPRSYRALLRPTNKTMICILHLCIKIRRPSFPTLPPR